MVDVNSNPMIGPLQGIGNQRTPTDGSVNRSGSASFGDMLKQSMQQAINQVDDLQQEADLAARKLVTGENKDIHGTMIAMQKASIAMELMIEVRNKVISAYDEIKRMQF
jgi:flagellar hook-basal body complex protein FliE